MCAYLWASDVEAPIAEQSSSPLGRGWGEVTETAIDTMLFSPRFVPCQLVHKTRVGHVLLTDAIKLAEDRFLLAAMLPPDHGLYHQDGAGRTDPMLMAEALRQACYYIQHYFYGVPDSHQFILSEIALGIRDAALLAAGPRWLPVNLSVTCTPTGKRTLRRMGLRLEAEFSVDGQVCGRGSLLSEAVDERIYQTVRRRVAPDMVDEPPLAGGRPLPGADVDCGDQADVLLSEDGTTDGWLLRVDQTNPKMFDHPLDHVPGMVLLEAFRQAALATTGPAVAGRTSLTGLRAEFSRFCELGAPARITAKPEPGHPLAARRSMRVIAEQAGAEVASGTIELGLNVVTGERVNR